MPASAPKALASDVYSIFASDAKQLLTSTRSHRSTENSVCWLLDGDDSRIRQVHAQHNLAVLRRMAFNPLPSENSAQIGIAAKRKRARSKTGYRLKLLSQQDAIAPRLDAVAKPLDSTPTRAGYGRPLSICSSFGILWSLEAHPPCRRELAAESERRPICRFTSISARTATTGLTDTGLQQPPHRTSSRTVRTAPALPHGEPSRRSPCSGNSAGLPRRNRARPVPRQPRPPRTPPRNRYRHFRPTNSESASRANERARPLRCRRLLLG